MKVAYLVGNTGKKYGIENYDHYLTRELKKLVNLFWFRLPYKGTLKSLIHSRKVIKDIAKEGYDLYHTSNNAGVILGELKLPTVFTVHHPSSCFYNYLQFEKQKLNFKARLLRRPRYWFEKRCFDHAIFIIAISNFARDSLVEDYKVPERKIEVINDGVDGKVFSSLQYSREVKTDYPGKMIIFYCGRLERDKNVARSILAVKKVKEKFASDFVFLIAGSGKQKDYLKQLVEKLDLRKTVHFLGRVADEKLPSYYATSDVFLNPSLLEGFGMSNLEAMASGLPVISSKIKPTVEVTDRAAFLVNPLSVAEISQALEKALTDEKLRKELKERGLSRSQDFSWPETAAKVVEVYKKAIVQGGA